MFWVVDFMTRIRSPVWQRSVPLFQEVRNNVDEMRNGRGLLQKSVPRERSAGPGGSAAESITVAPSVFNHRQNASPSTRGIIQSVTMWSGCPVTATYAAMSPSGAVSTR